MRIIEELLLLIRKENGDLTLLGKILQITIIFIIIKIILTILNKVIEKHIYSRESLKDSSYGRIVTIIELIKKGIKFILYFFGFVMVLDTMDINPTSLIATAGIGSLAVGMAAKAVIQDFINGFLIILEDQYSIGDLVIVAGYEGIVESLDVRVTKIRAFDGQLHIIPNREVITVTNKQRGVMRARVDIMVDSKEEPKYILDIVEKAIDPVKENKDLVKGPNIWGVTANFQNYYIITIVAYANAGNQISLEYEIRQKIIEAFIENKVSQPQLNIIRGDI